jgi:hypothetical protein
MRSNAYLRAAQAYMLISMPTDTSAIFGAVHAIPELLKMGQRSSGDKVLRFEKFASEIFQAQGPLRCEMGIYAPRAALTHKLINSLGMSSPIAAR